MFPTFFISHGAPNTVLKPSLSKKNLRSISETMSMPNYIIVISSHWISRNLEIINPASNELMYDFYGFEKELYDFKYPLFSSETITKEIIEKLVSMNIKINTHRTRFDHGVWSVLSMMYERLDIPVIQLSLPMGFSTHELFNLGKALQIFRKEALIVCSGSITHNLYDMNSSVNATPKTYAQEFDKFIQNALENGEYNVLLEYEKIPYFSNNHPTVEHFIPLIIALGTSKDYKAIAINNEMTYSNISMSSYMFKG
jgi:4,5-DOPA dioxygenase extradiol